MTNRQFQAHVLERFERAGFAPEPQLVERLEVYFDLLATWNRKINLSGMSLAEPTTEALDRLLVEPVVAARHAAPGATQVIDIGSGGGSPAIPFALALPDARLLMVESKTRKSVFLREALRSLDMRDSEVITARFEDLPKRDDLIEAHDILTVRAVRVEVAELEMLQAFVRRSGQLLLFRRDADFWPQQVAGLEFSGSFPLVPALHSHLVVLTKLS